jgi:hypothetical protein
MPQGEELTAVRPSQLRVAALVLVGLTTACLAKRSNTARQLLSPELVHAPALNVEAQVEIGESMVSTAQRAVYPGIQLRDPVVHRGTNNFGSFTINIPKSGLFEAGRDAEGVFYQAPKFQFLGSNGSAVRVNGGVYVPAANRDATEVYWLAANDTSIPLNDDHPGIKFDGGQVEIWDEASFKRELVYGGISGNTITILYREFKDDFARPAFSQDLKYDLAQGDVIGYRGSRFQVLGATNTAIKYKVLKHLD